MTASTSPNPASDLARLVRVLPASPAWTAWLAASGELPPDFARFPSQPDLPDPLVHYVDGVPRPITSAADWAAERVRLQADFQRWLLGTLPPPPLPPTAEITGEQRFAGGVTRQLVLHFGGAHLRVELLIPDRAGRLPVFAAQFNHRSWALIALRRGYLSAVYAASDGDDDTDTFAALYPAADWSRLARRAWGASRLVDYLLTLPVVDPDRIVLAGHSRNGKQAVIAAAFDPRISAVVASSAGAFGVVPMRLFNALHAGESIELMTRVYPDWFHPRLRFFAGREDRLPFDLHQLVALVAPRPFLFGTALNDNVESTWAVARCHAAAQAVYRLLGTSDRIAVQWRGGGHETYTETVERYLDWADAALGVRHDDAPAHYLAIHPVAPSDTSDRLTPPPPELTSVHTAADWAADKPAVVAALRQMLGVAPPQADNPGHPYGVEVPYVAHLLDRATLPGDLTRTQLVFGDYVSADLYQPAHPGTARRPAVVWLAPFSFAHGYRLGYFSGAQPYERLARAGYVVCCFDPLGMGRRHAEAARFYTRHPRWSLLGRLVADATAAAAALAALPTVDADRVYAVGFGLGAHVALYAAALDERVRGVAAVAPPLDTATTYRRWFGGYPLLPDMDTRDGNGWLAADLAALMVAAAPRPLLLVAPTLNTPTPPEPPAVTAARRIYALAGAADRLSCRQPEDLPALTDPILNSVIAWLSQTGGSVL